MDQGEAQTFRRLAFAPPSLFREQEVKKKRHNYERHCHIVVVQHSLKREQ